MIGRSSGANQSKEIFMIAQRSNGFNELKNDPDLDRHRTGQHTYRRADKRIDYKAEVTFSVGSKISTGKIRNISIGGAAIQALDMPSIGDALIISIPFTNSQKNVRRKAVVRWVSGEVFGIKFLPHI